MIQGYLIAGVAGLGLCVGAYLYGKHEGREDIRQEIREGLATQDRTNRSVSRETVDSYRAEISRLRNKPARVVRLCRNDGLPVAVSTPGTDGSSTPGGELQEGPGPDLGPSLYSEADRADALAAQLRALHEWMAGNGIKDPN